MLAPITGPRAGALRLVPCALATLLLAACGGGGAGGPDASTAQAVSIRNDNTPFAIRTVNNRADLVSGGDALVEVTAPPGAVNSGALKITRNGADVTGAFSPTGKGTVVGLVTGLANGENVIEATVRGGPGAQLVVTNAPREGPVLSGSAHITPFHCATPTPEAGDGVTRPNTAPSGLSARAVDVHCNIPTEFKLYYRTTGTCTGGLPDPFRNPSPTGGLGTQPSGAGSCWKPYAGGTPADLASVTTDANATVPFIVRLERGTMNRGIYDIAVLFDPATNAPQAWNGKVYYSFGASTGQPRRQVRPATAWTSVEEQLKRGWLVVQNSMTDSARNSNRIMMSETVMMMKEHVADTYGKIRYTLGTGCSGGSINSNMNASINPGLLDGIVTTCTYPDSETTSMEVGDCTLLIDAYQKPQMQGLWAGLAQSVVDQKKAAINGHVDPSGCHAWFNAFGSNGRAGVYVPRVVNALGQIFPSGGPTNNCELPNTAVYNPADPLNTANLPRCNAWSWAESVWGKVPGSPAARDTRDNVGVQYGLKALKDGLITAEEFVTLNETIGGIDRDSTSRAGRSTADVAALEIAYLAGIVASGKQLAKTAIIDLRGWDDSNLAANVPSPGLVSNQIPIHHQWFSWAVRDRIEREYGDYGNQALWRFASTGLAPPGRMGLDAFEKMDQWLAALVTDTSGASIEQKVRSARPGDTADFCLVPETGERLTDMAACDANRFLKPSLSPRQVAGGPRSEDVLKCQLKPLNRADYTGISDSQYARLQAVFADGVCDWSKPGVGQQAAVSPLTFKAGPGGQPLPPAPVSVKK